MDSAKLPSVKPIDPLSPLLEVAPEQPDAREALNRASFQTKLLKVKAVSSEYKASLEQAFNENPSDIVAYGNYRQFLRRLGQTEALAPLKLQFLQAHLHQALKKDLPHGK